MHAFFERKENQYWTSCITINTGNPQKMWSSISTVLKRDKDPSASSALLIVQLPQFLTDKIEAVRTVMKYSDAPTFPAREGNHKFVCFKEYLMDEVRYVLLNSPLKTCSLYPIPTDILLEYIDVVVLPPITEMCSAH
jgi:hypothetical protein